MRDPAQKDGSGYDDEGRHIYVSDTMIAQCLSEHDARVIEIIVMTYMPKVLHTLKRKFGTRIPSEDLEDIVLDAIIRVFKKGNQYDPAVAKFSTWLNTNAHFQALQFLRKEGLTDNSLDELADHLVDQTETEPLEVDPAPSSEMEEFLKQLPSARAEVIRMHYYNGLSVDQIAHVLNLRRGSVKGNLSRARESLRRLLHEREGHDNEGGVAV